MGVQYYYFDSICVQVLIAIINFINLSFYFFQSLLEMKTNCPCLEYCLLIALCCLLITANYYDSINITGIIHLLLEY